MYIAECQLKHILKKPYLFSKMEYGRPQLDVDVNYSGSTASQKNNYLANPNHEGFVLQGFVFFFKKIVSCEYQWFFLKKLSICLKHFEAIMNFPYNFMQPKCFWMQTHCYDCYCISENDLRTDIYLICILLFW